MGQGNNKDDFVLLYRNFSHSAQKTQLSPPEGVEHKVCERCPSAQWLLSGNRFYNKLDDVKIEPQTSNAF